ncbi:ribonuclease E inhibitor RraB [Roseateles sp. BYS180W]|uniref:Ribonuclease E inhibitor RraB n=1 Tax=Roseateles rivi TaxID=3299028 RepID=A0ABW7FTI8_9BURK
MPTPADLLATLQDNDDPDALVLLEMAKAGSDLRKPHEPEFVFEVESQAIAQAIANELCELDYEVQLYEPDDENPDFQVVAKRVMLLELQALTQLSAKFEALAERYGASYDGWGAELVE